MGDGEFQGNDRQRQRQGLSASEGSWLAAHQAPQVLYGILGQQSLLVTYAHNFQLFGMLCLVTTPLVFFFKKVRKAKPPLGAH